MDLTNAVVVTPSLSRREKNAVALLTDEVAVRVQRRLPADRAIPAGNAPIVVGRHRSLTRAFGKELGRHLPSPPSSPKPTPSAPRASASATSSSSPATTSAAFCSG